MAKEKKEKQEETSENAVVRLKPILGVAPERYLPLVYLCAGLIILFMLLFLPGIRKSGSVVSFVSVPERAAVFVDGLYAGTTPFSAFVPKGDGTVRFDKPGFETEELAYPFKGRLFGSLFIPRKDALSADLELTGFGELASIVADEYGRWAMVDRFYSTYRPEPVLELGALDIAEADPELMDEYRRLLIGAMAATDQEVLAKDLLRAAARTYGGPGPVTPASYIEMVRNFIQLQNDYENIGFWLFQNLADTRKTALAESAWFRDYLLEYERVVMEADAAVQSRVTGETVTVRGLTFAAVPAGSYVAGSNQAGGAAHPHPATAGPFYIMDREVTGAMYAAFLRENPEWALPAKASLAERGLVTGEYLDGFSELSEVPVSFVSWYAAEAFCRWLSDSLPVSLSGYTVRLPKEREWEWAAKLFPELSPVIQPGADGPSAPNTRPSGSFVRDLNGNLWEWCEDGYLPASYTLSGWDGASLLQEDYPFPAAEASVRGGSWANTEREAPRWARGSQPREWCTEFIGFRPVIAKDE